MYDAGFFNDTDLLLMGFELLTYNSNYRHAGFYNFYFYTDSTGTLNTNFGLFYSIYPTKYDV